CPDPRRRQQVHLDSACGPPRLTLLVSAAMSRHLAQAQVEVPLPAQAASEGLCDVLRDLGYELEEGSLPGAAELIFDAKRTILYTARQGGARITQSAGGSTIELGIDAAPDQATGLMDGKRNRRLMEELTSQITARLGA